MNLSNALIFLIYALTTTSITFLVIKLGEKWAISWFTLLIILSNFFALKQITLLNLHITASDPLIIAWIIGLNLSKEFFSKETSKEIINLAMVIAIIFALTTHILLLFTPHPLDWSYTHFKIILSASLRIIFSSIFVFFFLQKLDSFLFYLFKRLLKNTSFTLRSTITSLITQGLFAIFFSHLAFYGLVKNVWHLIIVNFLTKLITLISLSPIIHFMSKIIEKKNLIKNEKN